MDAGSDLQFCPTRGEIITSCACVRNGTGKAVQLRHDQGIAGTHGSHRLIEAWAAPGSYR